MFVPEEEKRRSARLADKCKSKGAPVSCIKKAQRVLMARLGMCEIDGEPPVDCLQRYAEYFKEPLPPSRIEAVANLFFLDAPFSGEWLLC